MALRGEHHSDHHPLHVGALLRRERYVLPLRLWLAALERAGAALIPRQALVIFKGIGVVGTVRSEGCCEHPDFSVVCVAPGDPASRRCVVNEREFVAPVAF